MVVRDADENCQDGAITFDRVELDHLSSLLEAIDASRAAEIGDAHFRKDVSYAVRFETGGLLDKECAQQTVNLRRSGGAEISVSCKLLQFLLLATQHPVDGRFEACLEDLVGVATVEIKAIDVAGRALVRQERMWMFPALAHERLVKKHEKIDIECWRYVPQKLVMAFKVDRALRSCYP